MKDLKSKYFAFFSLKSKESLVIYIVMLCMGACGLAYEYTLSKIASDLLGNSVRQWAIIIGIMMFFMGLGADLQKHFGNENLFDKFILSEIFLGLLGGLAPILLLYTYGRYPDYYIIVQYFFISAIGLLIGFEIPFLTRINETYTDKLSFNLGNILKMDYIGALLGALLWTFFLPRFFTISQTSFVIGIVNTLVAIASFIFLNKLVRHKKTITFLLTITLAALIIGLIQSNQWTSFAEQYLYKDRIIFSTTTRYQHIVLTKSRANDISCYINGNLQFNSFDEHIYHENLVHPAFHIAPRRKNVLILGGGDGLALREILKYPGVENIVLCDIDPEMTRLCRENPYIAQLNENSLSHSKLTLLKNNALIEQGKEPLYIRNNKKTRQYEEKKVAQIQVINIDAALFIEQVKGLFDLIIIDFPDPNSPGLAKLYSKKFYTNLSRKLSASGIFVQQSTSPVYSKEAFLCIGRTMEDSGLAVVPYHDNVPSFGEWGFWMGGKKKYFTAESIKADLGQIKTLAVDTKYLSPELIKSSLYFAKEWRLTKYTDINTIMNNRVYHYYYQAWERFM